MTISRAEKSLYRSLKIKKEREETGLFLVEGIKPVTEALLAGFPLERILISDNVAESERLRILSLANDKNVAVVSVAYPEIDQISSLLNPEGVLAVAKISAKENLLAPLTYPALYLWQINDPGNLGAILRTALWFDCRTILLSPESVDIYSPKVVRGAMGANFRLTLRTNVDIHQIEMILAHDNSSLWATDSSGTFDKPTLADDRFILAFGSESHGLPPEILQRASGVLRINKYGYGESLNLAVSVGIMLHTIRQK